MDANGLGLGQGMVDTLGMTNIFSRPNYSTYVPLSTSEQYSVVEFREEMRVRSDKLERFI